jgi:hypothetical protein
MRLEKVLGIISFQVFWSNLTVLDGIRHLFHNIFGNFGFRRVLMGVDHIYL